MQQQLNISSTHQHHEFSLNYSTRSTNDYYLNEDDEYDLDTTNNYGTSAGKSFDNDDHKAFDENVFDLLKVNSENIASQLTLIDIPLFKKIQPDELISCKWMSREKALKTPNIVQFTKRFNQTTFWAQKEILSCVKLETRAKMLTLFIKIAKRLQEMQNFNSLMSIISALKSAPIYRLKKTWNLVARKDLNYFERISKIILDTNDNKSKLREMHNNCKLPCIPFLGLYLTDLIYIDIAHPNNCFDNPQRRNQMNNICRVISEYQQSQYDKLIEINYVINYLNSFVYFEEFQKFKEDDYYKESLILEPDDTLATSASNTTTSTTTTTTTTNGVPVISNNQQTQEDSLKSHLNNNNNKITSTPNANLNTHKTKLLSDSAGFNSLSNATAHNIHKHRKALSLAFPQQEPHHFTQQNNLSIDKDPLVDEKSKHPLDDCLLDKAKAIQEDELEAQKCCANDVVDACVSIKKSYNDELSIQTEEDERIRIRNDVLSKIKNEKLRKSFEIYFLHTLNKEQMLNLLIKSTSNIIVFESAIRRKCIMKNSQKTHFKQWKTYWIQLVGNTLVYYSINKLNTLLNINYKQQQAETIQTAILASSSSSAISLADETTSQTNADDHLNHDCFNDIIQLDRKYYHKETCKVHTISNWMCVSLFDNNGIQTDTLNESCTNRPRTNSISDDDSTTQKPISCLKLNNNQSNGHQHAHNSSSTCSGSHVSHSQQHNKYDIQLNDLTNGNIYKYRLYNYKLAKEWYLLFKHAINLHEHLKPDNLIKFE